MARFLRERGAIDPIISCDNIVLVDVGEQMYYGATPWFAHFQKLLLENYGAVPLLPTEILWALDWATQDAEGEAG